VLDLYVFDVDTSSTYQLRIFDGSGLTLTADFDPGDFVTITASGVLSPAVGRTRPCRDRATGRSDG